MFNVIVIDDEQIIREGLKSYIDENIEGFSVVSVFEDGVDALLYLKENKENVDLVLTDIRMNTMSGTELVKHMHDLKLDILTLFLSSFREYEYAKTAIKYNVFAYIEKPIDFFELDEVFSDAYKLLSESKQTHLHAENIEASNSAITVVLNWLNDNFNQNITLAKAAEFAKLSPVYFGKLFKMNTGETFTNYLTKLRLNKARELLKSTPLNVQEVSVSVGYGDVNYFIRLFKKEHGVTPHRYKNNGRSEK